MRNKWTPAKIDRFKDLYGKAEMILLESEFGLKAASLHAVASRLKVRRPKRPKINHYWGRTKTERFKHLFQHGATIFEISKAFGIAKDSVYRVAHDLRLCTDRRKGETWSRPCNYCGKTIAPSIVGAVTDPQLWCICDRQKIGSVWITGSYHNHGHQNEIL